MQNKVLKNTSWIIVGNALAAVIVFVTSVIVAKNLSVSDFGFFQLIYTYFIFIQASENLTHPNILKSLFHDSAENKNQVISSAFFVQIAIFGLFFLGSLGGWYLTQNYAYLLMALLVFGQFFKALAGISYFFDYSLDSGKSQISQLLGNILCGVFRSSIVFFDKSLNYQALGLSGASAIAATMWLLFSRSWFSLKDLFKVTPESWDLAKKIVSASTPLWLISLLHFVLFKVDILILGAMSSPSDIALYANAVRLTEPWSFVVTAMATSFFPLFLSAKKKSTLRYYKQVGFYFRMLIGISALMAVGLSLGAPFIVRILYGEKYAEVANILRFHAFNLIPFFLVVGIQIFDVIEGFKRFSISKFIAAGLLAIGLNIVLIPSLGPYACVIASFISYSSLAVWLNIVNRRAWRFTVLTAKSFKYFRDDVDTVAAFLKRIRGVP